MFWFCLFCFLLCILCFVIAIVKSISSRQQETDDIFMQNTKPKIGAEVSNYFYDEVKQYCNKHHITISDLIRNAVRAYMDSNR